MKIRYLKRDLRRLHAERVQQLEALKDDPEACGRMGPEAYLTLRTRLEQEIPVAYEMIREGAEVVPDPAPAPVIDPDDPAIDDEWRHNRGGPVLIVNFLGPRNIGVTEPDGERRNIRTHIFMRDYTRQ